MGEALGSAEKESARGRVRRLFLNPLVDAGFRFKVRTDPSAVQKALDNFCDGLAYMSDGGLTALSASMMTKGEGAARCFWPKYATVIGYAEAFEPRPLEEVPGVASWFASRAGADALAANRLVSEFAFWNSNKRPPIGDREWAALNQRADDTNARIARIRDRQARGVSLDQSDAAYLRGFEDMERRAMALLSKQGKAA